MSLRKLAIRVAWSCYGVPYIYGGQSPLEGLDCSGLIVWIFRQLKIFEPKEDYKAIGLWGLYRKNRVMKPAKGVLVFYGKTKVTHVGICVDDQWCLCASGGNKGIDTFEKAKRRNAMIKLKKVHYRGDLWAYADPFVS